MNMCPKKQPVFFLCHAEFHCHGSLATICCRRFCCHRESWTKQLSLWWLPQSKSEERFEVGLDLQSTLGGVSELGVDGWLWVRLDGEFPNSKSAGLVKSLTDWSQLKRCKDVFVNLTSWSTRSHTWLCSKIPMAFLFRARKRHKGGRWDTVALLSLGCTASRGQPCWWVGWNWGRWNLKIGNLPQTNLRNLPPQKCLKHFFFV